MSAVNAKYLRFGAAIAVIVLTLSYLAYTGTKESSSYYKTIPEIRAMGDSAYGMRLRVAGIVVPGSIKRHGTTVEFLLSENENRIPVTYQGTEAPPDTFKDSSQALAEGQLGHDGVFHATELQAKCASKYAPAENGTPANTQTGTAVKP
jgi:cytochrome c-type biogenesis protein CcmE